MQFYHFSKILVHFSCCTLLLTLWCSCEPDQGNSKSIEEIQTDGQISSIIRSPVTASGPTDTVNVAKMEFEKVVHDFGEVKEGDVVKYTFKFVNSGKVPLIINDAHSTCGCTIPKWPQAPIAAGASGQIQVEFNTKNKPNNQEKPVIINANTYPSVTKVFLKGFVVPEQL